MVMIATQQQIAEQLLDLAGVEATQRAAPLFNTEPAEQANVEHRYIFHLLSRRCFAPRSRCMIPETRVVHFPADIGSIARGRRTRGVRAGLVNADTVNRRIWSAQPRRLLR